MKSIVAIVFILSSLFLNAQDAVKNYDEAFKLIDVWLQAQTDYEQYPGLSVIVIKDQEELWSSAYGFSNVEQKTKMKPETICSICSISKLFTSVAIMKLYDESKLRLDDRVEDLLPWYNLKQQYKTSGPVTVRSLLTHSSGLPRESDFAYWNGPDFKFPTKDEVKSRLTEQETLYPASNVFQYSNLGMTLLGEIVEAVSGKDFKTYVSENILNPLALENTRPSLPSDLYGSELAIGYSSKFRDLKREKLKLFNAEAITPAAGFSSNVYDLGKFASWQLRVLDNDSMEILKPSTLRNMHNVHWTNPDFSTTWGLGFSVYKGSDGSKWIGHGGSCPGYQTTLRINPKTKMAYSVMINANGTSPAGIAADIHAVLMKTEKMEEEIEKMDEDLALVDGEVESTEENTNNPKPDLKDFVGYYSNQPWWSESYIATWNGRLVSIDLPTDNPADSMTFFKHVEDDTFVRVKDNGELAETLTFYRDDSGKVIKAKGHGYFSERIDND